MSDNCTNVSWAFQQPPVMRPIHSWLRTLIREPLVMFMVALNALALFLAAFPDISPGLHSILFTIDYICILYFILELTLKLYTYGSRGYFAVGLNIFDFTIVVLSLPALAEPFGLDEFNFGALLVLRLARLFRFLRILRFIPNLDRMVDGARRALQASVGVLLVLLLWNFIFALAATYLFGLGANAVPQFSDPLVSMYTIFKVFTVEGWYEMPDLLAASASPIKGHLIRMFFVTAVVFGGILILGLLNAVFVDEMSSDLAAQTEDEVEALTQSVETLRAEVNSGQAELLKQLSEIQQRLKELER